MLEYTKWLLDKNIAVDETPFMRGFSSMGISMRRSRTGVPWDARGQGILEFGFAIPNLEALETIKKYSPILEIGAGSGYWAYELKKLGVDIICTDPKPYSDCHTEGQVKQWTPTLPYKAEDALALYPDRTLLTIWPSYNVEWPTQALKQYKGRIVIYVGEWRGCTADDEFHDILEEQFTEIHDIQIPVWSCIHDRVYIYERKDPT